jgi:hypothetical protein
MLKTALNAPCNAFKIEPKMPDISTRL